MVKDFDLHTYEISEETLRSLRDPIENQILRSRNKSLSLTILTDRLTFFIVLPFILFVLLSAYSADKDNICTQQHNEDIQE